MEYKCKCIDCKNLVSVGCNRVECFCIYFKQIISRPEITSCSHSINERSANAE